jgi:glyoxylase-like metal-dependent hydrolase (beta-lactamase superfamily II)
MAARALTADNPVVHTVPRAIVAPNPSPMTLDGTVTYVVGRRTVAIIDPGSAAREHLDALAAATVGAAIVRILVTHDHPDHSDGAGELADRLRTAVLSLVAGTLHDGDQIATDDGELVCVATPGHAPDHVAFHWPAARAIFCGDLMIGGMDTSVVAAPEGDLGAYLASLERVRSLRPRIIYPAHGPAFTDPDAALDRYVSHRVQRERQVLAALATGARDAAEITDHIYGPNLDAELREVALGAVEAYLEHLRTAGRLPVEMTR